MKTLALLNSFLRTLLACGLAAVIGVGGWMGYQKYNAHELALLEREEELAAQRQQIELLEADVAAKAVEIERLDTAMRLLKVDRRVAQIVVVDQQPGPDGRLLTQFRFSEVTPEGQPLGESKTITIEGDIAYFDAWVVKYQDEHVESGDPLRSTSVCLFRRIFGEFQQPNEGLALDEQGARPSAYGGSEPISDFEREIWTNFWEYANDPDRAEQAGVRAAHGEAPSIKLRPGKLYRVQLRASDGLSIVAEDLPAALRDPAL